MKSTTATPNATAIFFSFAVPMERHNSAAASPPSAREAIRSKEKQVGERVSAENCRPDRTVRGQDERQSTKGAGGADGRSSPHRPRANDPPASSQSEAFSDGFGHRDPDARRLAGRVGRSSRWNPR